MFLTRIGDDTQVIINGDVSQTDLRETSGLRTVLLESRLLEGPDPFGADARAHDVVESELDDRDRQIGDDTQVIINGDVSQTDLRETSGLRTVIHLVKSRIRKSAESTVRSRRDRTVLLESRLLEGPDPFGADARVIINGDVSQTDLRETSGLRTVIHLVKSRMMPIPTLEERSDRDATGPFF
jgi:phosphate starvation-inducible protein PhoH